MRELPCNDLWRVVCIGAEDHVWNVLAGVAGAKVKQTSKTARRHQILGKMGLCNRHWWRLAVGKNRMPGCGQESDAWLWALLVNLPKMQAPLLG